MKMDQVVEIKNAVKNHTIETCRRKPPTYVQPFLIDWTSQDIILLYRLIRIAGCKGSVSSSGDHETSMISELDLTGSPLECPFSPVKVEDTFLTCIPTKLWQLEEESHGSISVNVARNLLSTFNLYLQFWELPVWVVCDGGDASQTVLMSAFCDKKNGWVTRSSVRLLGQTDYEQAEGLVEKVKMEHLAASNIKEHEMKAVMTHKYDIYGSTTNNDATTDSSVSLQLSWTCYSIRASPPDYADAIVDMIVAVEQPASIAYQLWNQLKFLNSLVTAIAESEDDLPTNLSAYDNSNEESSKIGINDILTLIHDSDHAAINRQSRAHASEELSDSEQKLSVSVNQVVSGRFDLHLDFTYSLFFLLSKCRTSGELVQCFRWVFEEIKTGGARIYIHPKNTTKIAEILRGLMRDEISLPELTEREAKEILLEIGLQKLSRDYGHIFLSSELALHEQLKLPSENPNILENSSEQFDILARLHVTLEILLLAETHLNFSISTLKSLTDFVLNQIEMQVKSFSDLLQNRNIKFQAPVSTKSVQNLLTRRYSSWKMQLTSEKKNFKLHSILHCSRLPVFPYMSSLPTDSQFSEDSNSFSSEELYCSQLTTISNKIK